MYRVVLTIVETDPERFNKYIDSCDFDMLDAAMMFFISNLDSRIEVKRVYQTAKVFESYSDAKRCYLASLRDFNFHKNDYQYFKVLQIEEYCLNNKPVHEADVWRRVSIHNQIDEISGKGEEG